MIVISASFLSYPSRPQTHTPTLVQFVFVFVPSSHMKTKQKTHQTPIQRPFFTRTGGNKSASQPNDLFEVMAEAQETGGVLQRHLGQSRRFGVPDNYDYRPADGTAPSLPLRASSLRVTRPK